jgi:hypothetical protein
METHHHVMETQYHVMETHYHVMETHNALMETHYYSWKPFLKNKACLSKINSVFGA